MGPEAGGVKTEPVTQRKQVTAETAHNLQQTLGRRWIRTDNRAARAADSGFLPTDGLPVRPQPFLVIAIDRVTDPHNLGAVLRSAGAFGVDGVVVPERRAAGVSAAVWKVSAGAAARVPVARATNLVRTLKEYQKAGCFVVGLDGEAPTAVADLELATEPLVVVTGSEGKGLSRLVRETCDAIAGIEIASRVESLNAAVATGIALYEIARIRTTR